MDTTGPVADRTLRVAAQVALGAPSILNTQPWRWSVADGQMQLRPEWQRQLTTADPDGRMLTVSCGAALHHAKIALTAAGWQPDIALLPDPDDRDLLAVVRIAGRHVVTNAERTTYAAISRRRTDRRAFTAEPVPAHVVDDLLAVADAEGAHLAILNEHQVEELAVLAARAGEVQLADPDYRRELAAWSTAVPTGPANAAGIPAQLAVRPSERRVTLRDLAPSGDAELEPGEYTDIGALYAVLLTDQDTPAAWLHAGQALSALLLDITSAGLASAPMSEVTEVAETRRRLSEMLPGQGVPQLAVRAGYPPPGTPPASPRRSLGDVVNLWS